jgi:shikimate dehydrogenase
MATRRAAVLGSPIVHSRSPLLHRAAYAALGLDWQYEARDVTTHQLPAFMASCSWPEWAGLSLTMPLKTDVLGLLDAVTPLAAQVSAVNTVVFTQDGTVGHNTDVEGMRRSLQEAHGEAFAPRTGIVIGSGATARSALAALAGIGAQQVDVLARHPDRAVPLVDLGVGLGVAVSVGDLSDRGWLSADAVISTIPPGAADELAEFVPDRPGVLLDVAYGPSASALARAWAAASGPVADGLDLLLWQAVDQVTLMTGMQAPVSAMRAALHDERLRDAEDPLGNSPP